MFLKLTERPAFRAVGLKLRYGGEQGALPALWQQFVPRMSEVGNRASSRLSYGVMDNYDHESGQFDYTACVEVEGEAELPEGMVQVEVPAQQYAVFKTNLENVREAFDHAYQEWLPQSQHQRAPGPEFELYGEEFEADQTIYLYIPVRPG